MAVSCKKNMHRLAGFTLAEILLVITIIGIVAAQTIPVLNAQINRAKTIAQYKKVYSTLSQATLNVKEEMGGNLYIPSTYNDEGDPFFKDKYKKYLKYVKEYNVGPDGYKQIGDNGFFSTLDGSYDNADGLLTGCLRSPALVLIDGTVVVFDNYLAPFHTGVVGFVVDLNGNKPPNTIGKDIFFFQAYEAGNVEICKVEGMTSDGPSCDFPCDKTQNGENCGKAIMTGTYNID